MRRAVAEPLPPMWTLFCKELFGAASTRHARTLWALLGSQTVAYKLGMLKRERNQRAFCLQAWSLLHNALEPRYVSLRLEDAVAQRWLSRREANVMQEAMQAHLNAEVLWF